MKKSRTTKSRKKTQKTTKKKTPQKTTQGRAARCTAANTRPPRADALPGQIKYKAPESNEVERPLAKLREEAKLKRRVDERSGRADVTRH